MQYLQYISDEMPQNKIYISLLARNMLESKVNEWTFAQSTDYLTKQLASTIDNKKKENEEHRKIANKVEEAHE